VNALASWLFENAQHNAVTVLLLIAKISVLLVVAWLLRFALVRANPRWRVLVWRSSGVGIVLLAVLAVSPPILEVPIMSPRTTGDVRSDVETPRATKTKHHAPIQTLVVSPTGVQLPSAPDLMASDEPSVRPISAPSDVATVAGNAERPPAAQRPRSWFAWLTFIWLGGVLIGFARMAVGAWGVSRIRRQATDVPAWIKAEADRVAAQLGVRQPFGLRESRAIASPCLVGVWRPVILLPISDDSTSSVTTPLPVPHRDRERDCETVSYEVHTAELQPVLAHELAHLRGRDLHWNALLSSLATVLWFHPLAWRMRRAHADVCDEVADAIAADYVGDVRRYGSLLARLAIRAQRPAMTAGLAMARPSGVRRRVEALQRCVFRHALPRRRRTLAVIFAAAAGILLGGFGVTRTVANFPEAAKSDAPSVAGKIIIHAVNDTTGEPVTDAQLQFNGRIAGERINQYLKTNGEGIAEFTWKKPGRVESLWMTAKKSALVPIHYTWRADRSEVTLPARLDLRFHAGEQIGGVVHDEAGQPVPNVKMELTMPVTWPDLANHVFDIAELRTDEAGRWQFDRAPPDVASVHISVEHPDYINAGARPVRGINNILVLKQGLRVAGYIMDRDLKPIPGAKAALGFDRFGSDDPRAVSDEEGYFVLKNCKPGRSLVTIQAEGFCPEAKELVVGEQNEELHFMLEPGHTLRARVVDIEGKPVQGAFFATDAWRGYRSLAFRVDTPEDGRVVWHSAPPDTVLCSIGKTGYMAARDVPIKPGEEEQLITLHPVLEISGRVTDAITAEPIDTFKVTHGYQFANSSQTRWSNDGALPASDGKYSYKFDEPMKGYLLQVVAAGYRPATSRLFESTEGKITYDFTLEPGTGPSGIVLLPNGKPAMGAQVGLATREKRAMLDMGRFDRSQNHAEVVETDAEGRFAFTPRDDESVLVVLHDAGFAEVMSDELSKVEEITLRPWGRIEGRVLVGQKTDTDREVKFQPIRRLPSGRTTMDYVFSYGYETNTDHEGRFVMDRVIPGPGSIARVVITEFLRTTQHAPGWHQRIEVRPDETVNVTIGGTGRAVTGEVVLDRDPGVKIDWRTNEPAAIVAWDNGKGRSAEPYQRYLANVNKAGRFEIPDVPAGDYQLVVEVNNPPVPNACGAGDAIGRAELKFTIPEMRGGRSDEPLDLGEITATLFDTLDVGELAPDFVAERLDGGTARLSELRGKLVLLDFWATWCGPCVAELPTLKEIEQRSGDNPQFALLSISCDNEAEAAKSFVEEHGLAWQHVNVGGTASRIPKDYTVRTLPATFLIGPDGRVIAKNLRGEELKRAVAAALGNAELFLGGAVERAARYPVVHFEPQTAADSPRAKEQAAVIIADDTDPNYDPDRPHTDGLRLLGASGEELWSISGFNNCQTVGGIHGVAVDRARDRIYVRELVSQRISAYTTGGKKLWQIEDFDASTLAVDPQTGNLWASGGPSLNDGETVVFDSQGNELAAYPFVGIDMAFDPHSDSFWLVGYEVIKLSRNGEVKFRKPVDGWCCASVSVNPTDGSVWVAERDHPDVARSKNRLWLLASDGSVKQQLDLGKDDVFVVACDLRSGDAWFSGYGRGLRRVTPAGELKELSPVVASNIAFSPTTGEVWVATNDAVLKLDRTGAVLAKIPHRAESSQAWLAVF
jgi:beta-lactamase regulating signal transducer with metallopeptidase domain/thiol-disulfide isomerase/thioredoxin/DNA-binding beta-propeller fold protein YncE